MTERRGGWLIAYAVLGFAVLFWNLSLQGALNDERDVRRRDDAAGAQARAALRARIDGLQAALDEANRQRVAAGLPPIMVMPTTPNGTSPATSGAPTTRPAVTAAPSTAATATTTTPTTRGSGGPPVTIPCVPGVKVLGCP